MFLGKLLRLFRIIRDINIFMDDLNIFWLLLFLDHFITLKKHEHLFSGSPKALLFSWKLFIWLFNNDFTFLKAEVTSTSSFLNFEFDDIFIVFNPVGQIQHLRADLQSLWLDRARLLEWVLISLNLNWLWLDAESLSQKYLYWYFINLSVRIGISSFLLLQTQFRLTNLVECDVNRFRFLRKRNVLLGLSHFYDCLCFTCSHLFTILKTLNRFALFLPIMVWSHFLRIITNDELNWNFINVVHILG